nr:uncharacterized protein LOC105330494 [Crassostrea gigas]
MSSIALRMMDTNLSLEEIRPTGVPARSVERCRLKQKNVVAETADNSQSDLPDFHLLKIEELVLQMAQLYRHDVLALPVDEDYNRGKRYAAYRQYILWHHGRLGVGIRR